MRKEKLESELTLNYITREQSDVTEMAQLDMSINFVYSGLHNGTEIVGCVDDGGNVVLWKVNGDQTAIFLQNNDRISTWDWQHQTVIRMLQPRRTIIAFDCGIRLVFKIHLRCPGINTTFHASVLLRAESF